MQKVALHLRSMLYDFRVPRDGTRRYFYDIWQPLTLLVLTIAFTTAFFATYDPRTSTSESKDFFFCNADGNIEASDYSYEPFWDARLYFTVNVPFGSFPFSTVKIIDAAWDAMVGRGGQVVAAMLAYQTLRRSLTLTMETCTVAIPCVVSLCGQQVHLGLVGQLVHTMIWHWGSSHPIWRRPFHAGRVRFGLQVFVCVYLLLFSTIVSVMTGYRAQLSGYFGYDSEGTGQLFPISQLVSPRLAMYDDSSRVFADNDRMFAYNAIVYPEGVHEASHSDPPTSPFTSKASMYNVSEMLASSRDFEEPYGSLVDYYYTCMAVERWMNNDKLSGLSSASRNATARSLHCAFHECSCGSPAITWDTSNLGLEPSRIMYSEILVRKTMMQMGQPPLSVGLLGYTESPDWLTPNPETEYHWNNVSDFWADARTDLTPAMNMQNGSSNLKAPTYMHNETVLDGTLIKQSGRCIAEDAYSWGLSSLLLLTFCCHTMLFAASLILLQTDIYWNSRHDRSHQAHSIYTDLLYLAEELKATFGHDVEDHMQSPKAFEKKVERWKQGLSLDVHGLPLSRWQEWRLRRATMRSDQKAKVAPTNATDSMLELRNVSSRNRGGSAVYDTAYHGLVGGDIAESSFDAVSRSERRSTSGELTPSLASMQRSTEGSVHDGTVFENPVAESSLLEGDLAGGAGPAEWDSRNRLPRTNQASL